ncbi:MAG: GHKL domain-containing protein [Opitutae bacterium]|nr:GHKL domain-containing protein [Opitutae bacterium]
MYPLSATLTPWRLSRPGSKIFLLVAASVLVVSAAGGWFLFEQFKDELMDERLDAARWQAKATSRLLADELQGGATPAQVVARLQLTMQGMTESTRYISLLDAQGRLLTHPNPALVGTSTAAQEVRLDGTGRLTPVGRVAAAGQTCCGQYSIPGPDGQHAVQVYFEPVPGTSWLVAVHEDMAATAQHFRAFAWRLGALAAPLVLGMAAVGAGVAHSLTRRYERRIEAANAVLEQRVAERTAELRQAFADLQEAHRRLMHGDKMHLLGELMAGIAHEINSPLTVITGYADLLATGSCGPAAVEAGTKLQLTAERVRRIVGNLLAFARNAPPTRRLTSLATLLAETQELIGADLRRAQIVLTLDCPPDLAPLCIDPQQIGQVFLNLLNNSRQALETHPGERAIRVTVREQSGVVCVDFADTGPGLSPAVRARLFEPFHSTKATGNGLGLSLCRRLVQAHGAEIEALPVATGAVFRLHLPRAKLAETCPPPATAAPPVALNPAPASRA